jgi:hypothetical protein
MCLSLWALLAECSRQEDRGFDHSNIDLLHGHEARYSSAQFM